MYDVVVIGAGSSGSVIAARASEHPELTVCLLEAGPDYPLLHETPYDLVNSHDNSYIDHDWGYSYTPVPGGRSTTFPRGRVTGGSSAVNTTIALRGVPEDYDCWAELGNDGWSWDDVLPAFRRLERDLDFADRRDVHGDSGPISIRRYREDELSVPQAAWLAASDELGYPRCDDANDPDSWGSGMHPMNKLGRLRVSTAVGYLAPARARSNLTIRGGAVVQRLVIRDGRVTAAELVDGERVEGRLVVLAAGAIASPGILERSGIGRPEVLSSLGIDVVADVSGVGENLADHPAVALLCEARDGVDLDLDSPIVQTVLRYTAPGSEHRNDLQIEVFSFARRKGEATPRAFAMAAVLEHCFSRGSVHLTSADPSAGPRIEGGMCSDDRDVDRLAAGFLDAIAFTAAPALADIIESVAFPRLPLDFETARSLARRFAGSGYHPCGTVRMGPASDPMAVVDSRGRCHAVDRLVVADASIFPTVPRANTNLTAIMVGEMVGEWIRRSPASYGL